LRYQDYIVETTKKAAAEAFRYAKAVPADKLDWAPGEATRSVLDQCRELAMCPEWAADIVGGTAGDFSEEAMAAVKAEQAKWTTVEDCEAEFAKRFDKMAELFKAFPDEKLSDTKWLPYDGGRDFTVVEMMDYPRWNFTYHTGQIALIQMMYGDKEMH
jgi:hypothetical protein